MSPSVVVAKKLQSMGLTQNEAEVYLAALQEANGKPISAYRVAQAMGRDPANLSKILGSLERRGAVQSIQSKPRLFVPVEPGDFFDHLLGRMKNNQQFILEELRQFQNTPVRGIPMVLATEQHALTKATQLLGQCSREVLLFADQKILQMLGTALDAVKVSSDVEVQIISNNPYAQPGEKEKYMALPTGFSKPNTGSWLQLIVDQRALLVAHFSQGGLAEDFVGWWADDSPTAKILGTVLKSAWQGILDKGVDIVQENGQESTSSRDPGKVLTESEAEIESPAQARSVSKNSDQPTHDPDDEEGIQFIIRHRDEPEAE